MYIVVVSFSGTLSAVSLTFGLVRVVCTVKMDLSLQTRPHGLERLREDIGRALFDPADLHQRISNRDG
jgi:hypothetical protein